MRARNGRDRRARRGRYVLRDLAGFADVERLLAADKASDRRSHDVVDDDGPPTSRRRIDLAHDCTIGVEKLSSPKR